VLMISAKGLDPTPLVLSCPQKESEPWNWIWNRCVSG